MSVELLDWMGDDLSIVNAARVSYAKESRYACCDDHRPYLSHPVGLSPKDVGLIGYLMREHHGTPFEMVQFKFRVRVPIGVAREWQRHRIGCLAGDTEIWTESLHPKFGRCVRKRPIAEIYRNWHEGIPDSLGRVRRLPSCRNLPARVIDEATGDAEIGRMLDVFDSGTKELFEVGTEYRALRCSGDHRFLTPDGWARAEELSSGDYVAASGRVSALKDGEPVVPPLLRQGIGVWTEMQRIRLIRRPVDRCYLCQREFPFEALHLDHVVPVVLDLKLALDTANLRPACERCHREKTNGEQRYANRVGSTTKAGIYYERLKRKPILVAEGPTYDIAMAGPHHNFVANGLVVHNSFNEQSTRYVEMEPNFYRPPAEAVRTQVGKPGHYTFEPLPPDKAAYMATIMIDAYAFAFEQYRRLLHEGVAKELARNVLPLGLMTEFIWSVNLRSLFNFIALRTSPNALYEIREEALAVEQLARDVAPHAMAAFDEHGRVTP